MNQAKKTTFKQITGFIRDAKRILITTHENPDGDGIGSLLALGMGLTQLKKKVTLYMSDPVPKMYQFLPGQNKIKHTLCQTDKFDLTLIVDLGEVERVGGDFQKLPGRGLTVSIDHHKSGGHNADYNFCEPQKSSTGEIIFRLLKQLKIKFNKAMAVCVYTALVTDTGSFKYSNTNSETFVVAAEMAKFKIDFWEVASHCFETSSLSRMELLKRVIAGMQIHENKKLAWIVVLLSDLMHTGATPDETEGLINYPRSIEGVEVAIVFKEKEAGKFRVSLRSKTRVDVAAIAAEFGGGGHERASGFGLEGSFEDVKNRVISRMISAL
ncbi:MAG: bifunctional oligoribonuclease/PAP phosphatase NrnA [Deltaproteobacteria bacterium]|nr:bifunctional oligoribonuclease/PAP phosphatase NrnA [Deltaproteobacteria bacterium]